jgi:hypothetical protein
MKNLTKMIMILFLLIPVYTIARLRINQAKAAELIKPTKLAIVYEKPEWGTSGTALTNSEVATRFGLVVYSRTKMGQNLAGYKTSGFNGTSLVYLTALDRIAGPNGNYASIAGQTSSCTSEERGYKAYSDNVDMDTGDFCEIQDAIANGGCLREYPDICPKENFFLHQADGRRYGESGGNGYFYRPNPAAVEYQKYLKYRALREMTGGVEIDYLGNQTSHPATGASGIFLDNLEVSWEKLINQGGQPREFANSVDFANATAALVAFIHQDLNYPLWANIISGANTGTEWDRFINEVSLEGAMMEDFALNWGKGRMDATTIQNQMKMVERWLASGRGALLVAQANQYLGVNQFDQEAKYSLAAYLQTTNGQNVWFKLDNYQGDPAGNRSENYNQFFNYPEYDSSLGWPTGAKIQISTTPLTYQRTFENGVVKLDLTNGQGMITTNGDTQAPTVTITSPTNGTTVTVNSNVTISANASDNVGVSKLEFYVNNSLVGSDTTAPYSYVWRVGKKSGTKYNLTVKAYDQAGNTSSQTVSVTSR